ncbi:MAG: 6-phosphofructokinase, partial [Clostridia bacterium]|nr:6-phosphofructokinase [Clostridia bacterium]
IGILTAGGDCPGLNACIRGVARASLERFDAEIIGIRDGFRGLIQGETQPVEAGELSGILNRGGTILGTARTPYRNMRVVEDDLDKVDAMKKNYKKLGLDCLVTLGGNGTHKTANLLAQEGMNVIGLPKTIDNDIFGTDVTFGFHSAVEIATEVHDRIHTTAGSHGRIMVIEIMGNKVGWLTLYAGLAGGADIVLLPELPYRNEIILEAIKKRREDGRGRYTILAVAEGAISAEEVAMKKKDMRALRAEQGYPSVSYRVAADIEKQTGLETRVVVPGHIQRGGSPTGYDRVLATQFGAYAAELIAQENYGRTVAMKGNAVGDNALCDIAGKIKAVPSDHEIIKTGRSIGICFGDA